MHGGSGIGAGVIGAATALELARRGYRTLSVDRDAEAGHGSTSGSCAIIRVHYSTLDGTAFATRAITTGATRSASPTKTGMPGASCSHRDPEGAGDILFEVAEAALYCGPSHFSGGRVG
jgi:glycine/D-amino acid oxidase-like deaminating enzyme